ncbi:MAG: 4Fe-4S dicluster domain-containing protein [Actinobacteria bacterium]|nr:4Fe-4S dicluster domain-containing protein [Actinomycetota bacterium]
MGVDKEIGKFILLQDLDFFGFAELSPAYESILQQGGQEIADYPRAISIGIALPDEIVDALPDRKQKPEVSVNYQRLYDTTNQQLDIITGQISSMLISHGHKALAIPASKRSDVERICGSFSHKLAANLAGLGWIGKSCLLITPEAGPRVRFATVLTDAPLEVTGKPLKEQCAECRACVDICPVSSFTGKSFCADEPRETRYDARKCEKYLNNLKAVNGFGICGLCVYICPYGNSKKTI